MYVHKYCCTAYNKKIDVSLPVPQSFSTLVRDIRNFVVNFIILEFLSENLSFSIKLGVFLKNTHLKYFNKLRH